MLDYTIPDEASTAQSRSARFEVKPGEILYVGDIVIGKDDANRDKFLKLDVAPALRRFDELAAETVARYPDLKEPVVYRPFKNAE